MLRKRPSPNSLEREALPLKLRQIEYLEQAERHIALAKRQIAAQEQMIANLDRLGRDTTEARRLLDTFHMAQAQYVHHRDRVLKELEWPHGDPAPMTPDVS